MSQLVENYLNELYLYEELAQIDESFISWVKNFKEDKLKTLAQKMKTTFDMGDMQKVKQIVSKIPKPSIDNIEKLAYKISPGYKLASKEASKQLGQKFAGMPEMEQRVITIILGIINENTDNIITGVADSIKKLKSMIKSPKLKRAVGPEAAFGTVLVIGAAVVGLGAVIAINMPFFILALLIAGIALAFLMEGMAHGIK